MEIAGRLLDGEISAMRRWHLAGVRRRCVSGRAPAGIVERVKGIEPSYEAWEASVLPLNYARDIKGFGRFSDLDIFYYPLFRAIDCRNRP